MQNVLNNQLISNNAIDKNTTSIKAQLAENKSIEKVEVSKKSQSINQTPSKEEIIQKQNEIVTVEVIRFEPREKDSFAENIDKSTPIQRSDINETKNEQTSNSRYKDYAKERRMAKKRVREQKRQTATPQKTNQSTLNLSTQSANKSKEKSVLTSVNGNQQLSKVKNAGSIANSRQLKQASGDDKTDAEQVKSDIKPNSTPINNIVRNTNCPQSVSASKISDWTNRLSKKFDDEARANFLKRKIGANCININKIGVLLGYFDTQIGRYLFIRDMFSHIEDPGNMNRLYKYFSSSSYIEKLKDLQPSRN